MTLVGHDRHHMSRGTPDESWLVRRRDPRRQRRLSKPRGRQNAGEREALEHSTAVR